VTVTSILEAADRILRADGYEAASTNRVARVAGFSVGSLYQYFRDKQAIVGALIDKELAGEAELLRDLLAQSASRSPREIAAVAFGHLLDRRVARAHLYRTLDGHAHEFGMPSVLDHFLAAQAPVLSDTIQRVCAQVFPRSARSIDSRVFVISRVALSVSFAFASDAPHGITGAALRDEFAGSVERYLIGGSPSSAAEALAVAWSKPAGSVATLAEQRGRKRREARGVLLGRGVAAERLEPLAFLLAGVADAAHGTARPLHGATQDELLQEVARFVDALCA
jgi:AcrR family transcriptional regulator